MIISTNIFPEICTTIKQLEKWNIIPYRCPFQISSCEDSQGVGALRFRDIYTEMLYKTHTFILIIVPFISVYRFFFESTAIFDKAMDIDKFGLFGYMATCAVFYHREELAIARFFTELIKFEKRHVDGQGNC